MLNLYLDQLTVDKEQLTIVRSLEGGALTILSTPCQLPFANCQFYTNNQEHGIAPFGSFDSSHPRFYLTLLLELVSAFIVSVAMRVFPSRRSH